ncbi:MAG: Glycosyl transferase family 2 [Microgenomates bacterium OLB22]|nr:MAG: Glycosyl transferase family 2 [Microgenomates bacterium OLB22]
MKDQITIIIPVYNNAQLLVRTLKANLPHFGSYHVVIVDDASTEDIKGALQEVNFQGEYIKNRVNVGFGAR